MIRNSTDRRRRKNGREEKMGEVFFSASVCDAREPPSAHYVFLLEKEITGVKP
jgi:hypothetical protein